MHTPYGHVRARETLTVSSCPQHHTSLRILEMAPVYIYTVFVYQTFNIISARGYLDGP